MAATSDYALHTEKKNTRGGKKINVKQKKKKILNDLSLNKSLNTVYLLVGSWFLFGKNKNCLANIQNGRNGVLVSHLKSLATSLDLRACWSATIFLKEKPSKKYTNVCSWFSPDFSILKAKCNYMIGINKNWHSSFSQRLTSPIRLGQVGA